MRADACLAEKECQELPCADQCQLAGPSQPPHTMLPPERGGEVRLALLIHKPHRTAAARVLRARALLVCRDPEAEIHGDAGVQRPVAAAQHVDVPDHRSSQREHCIRGPVANGSTARFRVRFTASMDPASEVRQWLLSATTATLGTLAAEAEIEGWPFGSLAPFALAGDGTPLLLLSELAQHTRNLRRDARLSLFV